MSGVSIFFVPKSESFDFDLADELADLNREIVQRFAIGGVEVYQLPADEKERFMVMAQSSKVYSDADGSHQTVAT